MSDKRKGKISVHAYTVLVRATLGNRKLTPTERRAMREARLNHENPTWFATNLLARSNAETVPVDGAEPPAPTRLDVIHAERAADAKRLKAQAKRLRKAADLLDVAAAYHDDGAYQTALDRIAAAGVLVNRTVNYMQTTEWRKRAKA